MKIFFFSIMFLLNNVWADFDLQGNVNARSWPNLSGAAGIDIGYNFDIWGEINKTNPLYGFMRLEAGFDSSIVVNSADYRFTFYPISFIGLGAGRSELNSNFEEFEYFDCSKVRCSGNLDKDYLFGKMIIAYSNLVASAFYRESRNSYDDSEGENLPVGEYGSVNIVNPGDERSVLQSYFLGYVSGDNSYGLFSEKLEYLKSEQTSELNAVVYREKSESYQYTYGVGSQHSSVEKAQVTIFIDITYEFIKNKAIF